MENFDRVWLRVRGEAAPAPSAGGQTAALLRRRIDETCARAAFYAAAARRPSPAAPLLLCLERETRRQGRCLQLELFLLTGACHKPAAACPRLSGTLLGDLRAAWLGERAAAEALRADAADCPAAMGEILSGLAAENTERAARLRAQMKTYIVGD